MSALFIYLFVGFIVLAMLLAEDTLQEIGVLTSLVERVVFIWAWPAFLFVIFMFRFCRDENTPVYPRL